MWQQSKCGKKKADMVFKKKKEADMVKKTKCQKSKCDKKANVTKKQM